MPYGARMAKRQTIKFTDETETLLGDIKAHLEAFTGTEPTDTAAVVFAVRFTAPRMKEALAEASRANKPPKARRAAK